MIEELDRIREKQTALAWVWHRHAVRGPTGAIDAPLHADLVASGEDVPAILQRMAETESRIVDLPRPS